MLHVHVSIEGGKQWYIYVRQSTCTECELNQMFKNLNIIYCYSYYFFGFYLHTEYSNEKVRMLKKLASSQNIFRNKFGLVKWCILFLYSFPIDKVYPGYFLKNFKGLFFTQMVLVKWNIFLFVVHVNKSMWVSLREHKNN